MYTKPYDMLVTALQGVRDEANALVVADTRWSIDTDRLRVLASELEAAAPAKSLVLYNDLETIAEKQALILYYAATTYTYVHPLTGRDYIYNNNGVMLCRTNAYVTALLRAPVRWSDPASVLALSDDDWSHVLQLETSDLYLAQQRIAALRTLALAFADGRIQGVDERGVRADELFVSLMSTGLFEDRFLKRAQMGLAFLFELSRLYEFEYEGAAPLTAMADYRLPQLFVNKGVLVIDEDCAVRLREGHLFEKDSADEKLLRAYSIVICRQLADVLGSSESDADTRSWSYSQQLLAEGRLVLPAPRVATDCY